MKKKIFTLLVILLSLVALVSCGKKEEAVTETAAADTKAVEAPAKAETVTLRVVDWSDSAIQMRADFHKKFEENHPGVKVEYTCLTVDQFNNTVITLIKGGDAPDLFPIPSGKTLSMALKENWYQPMDQYLDQAFIDTFNPQTWQEGISTAQGHIWCIPEFQPNINSVVYYNKDILAECGLEVPRTYSEFRDACIEIAKKGNGRYWGWIEGGKQLNRQEILVRQWAAVAGAKLPSNGKVLTHNGKANFNCPEVLGVYNLFQEIVKGGGMHPDTLNIGAPEARELFAQGQAAFLVQGMWCIPTWGQTYPDLNYGVMDIPVPDDVEPFTYGAQGEQYGPWMGIYRDSKNPELAAEYLKCLYSEEYGYQAACVESGNSISNVPAINEEHIINPIQKEYYDACQRNAKVVPSATTRDEKVYDFYAEVKDVSPSLGNIFQGMISESIDDVKPYLDKFSEASTKEWKRACEAIGLDFGVFEFPNWDNTRDYTSEDYANL